MTHSMSDDAVKVISPTGAVKNWDATPVSLQDKLKHVFPSEPTSSWKAVFARSGFDVEESRVSKKTLLSDLKGMVIVFDDGDTHEQSVRIVRRTTETVRLRRSTSLKKIMKRVINSTTTGRRRFVFNGLLMNEELTLQEIGFGNGDKLYSIRAIQVHVGDRCAFVDPSYLTLESVVDCVRRHGIQVKGQVIAIRNGNNEVVSDIEEFFGSGRNESVSIKLDVDSGNRKVELGLTSSVQRKSLVFRVHLKKIDKVKVSINNHTMSDVSVDDLVNQLSAKSHILRNFRLELMLDGVVCDDAVELLGSGKVIEVVPYVEMVIDARINKVKVERQSVKDAVKCITDKLGIKMKRFSVRRESNQDEIAKTELMSDLQKMRKDRMVIVADMIYSYSVGNTEKKQIQLAREMRVKDLAKKVDALEIRQCCGVCSGRYIFDFACVRLYEFEDTFFEFRKIGRKEVTFVSPLWEKKMKVKEDVTVGEVIVMLEPIEEMTYELLRDGVALDDRKYLLDSLDETTFYVDIKRLYPFNVGRAGRSDSYVLKLADDTPMLTVESELARAVGVEVNIYDHEGIRVSEGVIGDLYRNGLSVRIAKTDFLFVMPNNEHMSIKFSKNDDIGTVRSHRKFRQRECAFFVGGKRIDYNAEMSAFVGKIITVMCVYRFSGSICKHSSDFCRPDELLSDVLEWVTGREKWQMTAYLNDKKLSPEMRMGDVICPVGDTINVENEYPLKFEVKGTGSSVLLIFDKASYVRDILETVEREFNIATDFTLEVRNRVLSGGKRLYDECRPDGTIMVVIARRFSHPVRNATTNKSVIFEFKTTCTVAQAIKQVRPDKRESRLKWDDKILEKDRLLTEAVPRRAMLVIEPVPYRYTFRYNKVEKELDLVDETLTVGSMYRKVLDLFDMETIQEDLIELAHDHNIMSKDKLMAKYNPTKTIRVKLVEVECRFRVCGNDDGYVTMPCTLTMTIGDVCDKFSCGDKISFHSGDRKLNRSSNIIASRAFGDGTIDVVRKPRKYWFRMEGADGVVGKRLESDMTVGRLKCLVMYADAARTKLTFRRGDDEINATPAAFVVRDADIEAQLEDSMMFAELPGDDETKVLSIHVGGERLKFSFGGNENTAYFSHSLHVCDALRRFHEIVGTPVTIHGLSSIPKHDLYICDLAAREQVIMLHPSSILYCIVLINGKKIRYEFSVRSTIRTIKTIVCPDIEPEFVRVVCNDVDLDDKMCLGAIDAIYGLMLDISTTRDVEWVVYGAERFSRRMDRCVNVADVIRIAGVSPETHALHWNGSRFQGGTVRWTPYGKFEIEELPRERQIPCDINGELCIVNVVVQTHETVERIRKAIAENMNVRVDQVLITNGGSIVANSQEVLLTSEWRDYVVKVSKEEVKEQSCVNLSVRLVFDAETNSRKLHITTGVGPIDAVDYVSDWFCEGSSDHRFLSYDAIRRCLRSGMNAGEVVIGTGPEPATDGDVVFVCNGETCVVKAGFDTSAGLGAIFPHSRGSVRHFVCEGRLLSSDVPFSDAGITFETKVHVGMITPEVV